MSASCSRLHRDRVPRDGARLRPLGARSRTRSSRWTRWPARSSLRLDRAEVYPHRARSALTLLNAVARASPTAWCVSGRLMSLTPPEVPTPEMSSAIARRVRQRAGALIVGGWVRDRLMGRARRRTSTSRSTASTPTGCATARAVRHRQHRRRELHGLQGRRRRRLAAAARVEGGAGTRIRGHRRSRL